MPRSTSPIDMLHKCRGHFAKEAEHYRDIAKRAPTVEAREIASGIAKKNERFVSQIDATMRDWG